MTGALRTWWHSISPPRVPVIQAIHDLEAPRMTLQGRVALTGDAAFVVRPHVGMGVTKAAADAWSLAHALEAHGEDIAGGLAAFAGAVAPACS